MLGTGFLSVAALAQAPADPAQDRPPRRYTPDSPPAPALQDWVPPALGQLSAQAAVKSSFTLDRAMLGFAASLLPDSDAETRQAVERVDRVSVYLLRFGPNGIPDEAAVDSIRQACHQRGWKHLVSTTASGGPVHSRTTDLWLVVDGANLRRAVVLAETPKSLTLVTVTGNLSPADLLHLRGHFGIPRFDDDAFKNDGDR